MLDIILLSWNAFEVTKLTLDSLCRNYNALTWNNIVIVDNGSSEDVKQRLYSYAESVDYIKIISNEMNLGVSKAVAQGLENSNSEYVVIINNDVIVPSNGIGTMLHELEQYSLDLISPVRFGAQMHPYLPVNCYKYWNFLKNQFGKDWDIILDRYFAFRSIDDFAKDLLRVNSSQIRLLECPMEFVSGSLMMFRRKSVENVGGFFDKNFGTYGSEDVDLCWRLGASGYKVGRSGSVYVHHLEHSSIDTNNVSANTKLMHSNSVLVNSWSNWLEQKYIELSATASDDVIFAKYPFIRMLRTGDYSPF
jgi:GT2 family glycosyltransferase